MTQGGGQKGWTLITAADGLGREFALLAAAEGRDLILAARPEAKLEALAETLRARHKIAVEVIPTDLADPETVELLWRLAASRRRVDMLVNSVGPGEVGPGPAGNLGREPAPVNQALMALTILTKRAATHMQAAGGGRILNVASLAAFGPGPSTAGGSQTAADILSLGVAMTDELRGSAVTVTTFCPGPMRFAAEAGAENVARAGWGAMKRGQQIRVIGLRNRLLALSVRFLPRSFAARVAGLLLK